MVLIYMVQSAEVDVGTGCPKVALAEAAGDDLQGGQKERLGLAHQRLHYSLVLHAVRSEFRMFDVMSPT